MTDIMSGNICQPVIFLFNDAVFTNQQNYLRPTANKQLLTSVDKSLTKTGVL